MIEGVFEDSQSAAGVLDAFQQHYDFYQAINVEATEIDTRGGDDVVRADPEFKFPLADGSGVIDSEWGIKAGNFQEGAKISNLTIRGGDGTALVSIRISWTNGL